MSVERFEEAQVQIVNATYDTNRTYAYAAGYFQSLAKQMFCEMTKRQQEEFLRQVEMDAAHLSALAGLVN
jgi:hypothetical protein